MKTRTNIKNCVAGALLAISCASAAASCASMKGFMAVETQAPRSAPIGNPFVNYSQNAQARENIILRTKKGDRAVEVELPGSTAEMTDFQIPLSPTFREDNRKLLGGTQGQAPQEVPLDRAPSITDREIASTFPQGRPEDDGTRREVESGLGLVPAEDPTPQSDKSYLASLDNVKQLYRTARYEAALLELDELTKAFPTDSKIYEMRGTLLDRLGKTDLAMRSWNQALRFNPGNQGLRKFIERRSTQRRGLASP